MVRNATQAATERRTGRPDGRGREQLAKERQMRSHRPPERPAERRGGGLAGSGCGWPL